MRQQILRGPSNACTPCAQPKPQRQFRQSAIAPPLDGQGLRAPCVSCAHVRPSPRSHHAPCLQGRPLHDKQAQPVPMSWYSLLGRVSACIRTETRIKAIQMARRATLLLASFALMQAGQVVATTVHTNPGGHSHPDMPCQAMADLRPLVDLGSIYFGEIHGTKEIPELIRCLVDAEVAKGVHPLTVSLELPAFARDLTHPFWAGMDGRASQAMMSLVAHLEELEQQGKIALDFQLTGQENGDEEMNRQVGLHLRSLSEAGQVIALGGNIHSQRTQMLIPSLPFKPAGSYMGERIKSIMLDPVKGGTAWYCAAKCGAHRVESSSVESRVGVLVNGHAKGHDFIYTIDTVTASPPAIKDLKVEGR